MAGHKPFQTLIDKMPPDRREAFEVAAKEQREQRVGELIAAIRRHTNLTQKQVATRLGVSQAAISKMEAADDMQLGTLQRLIGVLGGRVVIHMPTGDIQLTHTAD